MPQDKIIKHKSHHHYPSNTKGRDIVVGDVHGCFVQLMDALKLIDFNASYDRLFSVGDLIDRGANSFDCIDLIYEKWMYAIQGNHEQMMWNTIIHKHQMLMNVWMQNGGFWHKQEDSQLLYDIALLARDLPLIISVGEDENRFNIVHAEIVKGGGKLATDLDIDNWTFVGDEEESLTWGRSIISSYNSKTVPFPQKFQSNELSLTYVGHTPISVQPIRIQQQLYLDTGCAGGLMPKHAAVREKHPLTLACPQEQMCYCYSTLWKRLTKVPYKELEVK